MFPRVPAEFGATTREMLPAFGLSGARRQAGFTLAEIGELLVLDSGTDRARANEIARSRIDALDERIAELIDVRESLVRLAADCESGQDGPCPIIESFG